jgi:HEAT repeat protein
MYCPIKWRKDAMTGKRGRIVIGMIFGCAVLWCVPCRGEKKAESASSPQPTKHVSSRDSRMELRREMYELARIGDEESFSQIAAYAVSDDVSARRTAAAVLGRLHNKEAFSLLRTLLNDEDRSVREAAAISIGRQGNEESFDILVTVLEKDHSSEVKGGAIRGLGRLRTQEGLDKVLRYRKSEYVSVRKGVAEALGLSREKKVIEPLIEMVGDHEDKVREAALKSLERLTKQDNLYEATRNVPAGDAQRTWRRWWKANKKGFEIKKRRSRPLPAAGEAIKKYDQDGDGLLNVEELKETFEDLEKGKAKPRRGCSSR